MGVVYILFLIGGIWGASRLYDELVGKPRRAQQEAAADALRQQTWRNKEQYLDAMRQKLISQLACKNLVKGDPNAIVVCSNGHRYSCKDFHFDVSYSDTRYRTVEVPEVRQEIFETHWNGPFENQVKIGEKVTPGRKYEQPFTDSGSNRYFGCPQCHSRSCTFEVPEFNQYRLCELFFCKWWISKQIAPFECDYSRNPSWLCQACGIRHIEFRRDELQTIEAAAPMIQPHTHQPPYTQPSPTYQHTPPQGTPHAPHQPQGVPGKIIIVQCQSCGAKNRVPIARMSQALCGRCHQPY